MCLSSVEKFSPCKKGYKVMKSHNGGLSGQYRNTHSHREIGVWLDEKQFRLSQRAYILITEFKDYPTGWHTFHYKKDALAHLKAFRRTSGGYTYVLVEVSVRKPVVAGFQRTAYEYSKGVSFCKVTVSKEIRIDHILED